MRAHDARVRSCIRSRTTSGRNESAANFTEALNALNTLSYSSNLELQRSAALTFAEITEKGGKRAPPAARRMESSTESSR